ncbi:CinA family protein [Propionicimonas sp.]|uniref:CinA family protein n=1 Tax=Propionicimonas sp. TaxID=1955623 RepID=UPI0039E325D4
MNHAEGPVGGLVAALAESGLTVATAESLTGGLLAAELVSVAGVSAVFLGGIVCYDTRLKHRLLGVDAARLAETGPVDALVAEQMAEGVRHACAVDGRPADLGLATTGVAGPDPDPQTGTAAGTVYLGVATARGARSVRLDLPGGRDAVRVASVDAAIALALDELRALRPQVTG